MKTLLFYVNAFLNVRCLSCVCSHSVQVFSIISADVMYPFSQFQSMINESKLRICICKLRRICLEPTMFNVVVISCTITCITKTRSYVLVYDHRDVLDIPFTPQCMAFFPFTSDRRYVIASSDDLKHTHYTTMQTHTSISAGI